MVIICNIWFQNNISPISSHVENITEPLTGTGNTEIQKPDQNTVAIDISSSTPKCDSEFENTNLAIELSDTFKDYGSGKSRLPVLIGLNMNVVRGQIYGLLGKSLEFPLFWRVLPRCNFTNFLEVIV